MKRLITFALVLVMALSLAAPAMAFTGVAAPEASGAKPELAIKLVDLSEGFVTVNFNAPPTNRGYVTNEVVCAVVALQVPKGHDFEATDILEFSGVNVSLWQDDNFYGATSSNAKGGGVGKLRYLSTNLKDAPDDSFEYAENMAVDNWIRFDGLDDIDENHKNAAQTYHFAIFGRVMGENAKMNATLKGDGKLMNAYFPSGTASLTTASFTTSDPVKDGDFKVYYYNPNDPSGDVTASISGAGMASPGVAASLTAAASGTVPLGDTEVFYYVEAGTRFGAITANDALFIIVTDKNHNTKRMYVYEKGDQNWFEVAVVGHGGATIKAWDNIQVEFTAASGTNGRAEVATPDQIAVLANIVETIIAGEFGLDIRNIGNKLTPDWWYENETQTVEVAIEPWYAEVTVPPEIEIDIPKTGDAMSAVGFVLIALAGLAVVAVRKVRA